MLDLALGLDLGDLAQLRDQGRAEGQMDMVTSLASATSSCRGMLACFVHVAACGVVELIFLALGNEAVGSQVEDTFPHVPVRVLQEARGLRGEEPRRMTRNYQPTALQYCLPDHHFAIRKLLDESSD